LSSNEGAWIWVRFKVAMSDGGVPISSKIWLGASVSYFSGLEVSILARQFTLMPNAADSVG